MLNIILHGCCGAMGHVVADMAAKTENMRIAAGIDRRKADGYAFPVYDTCANCQEEADVIIDFSNAAAADELLEYAVSRKMPLVLCTTGLSDEQLEKVSEASKSIPLLRSANMSLGVNTLFILAAIGAGVLADRGYDIEIIEEHHHRKLDAPSGTALAIADAINEKMGGRYTYKYDRSSQRAARDPNEIGIQSVRGGSIVGIHDLLFCGEDEVIEIKHTAYSRNIFAKGALQAAEFLKGKESGLYDMSDVIG